VGSKSSKREVGIDARHVPAQRDEGIVDTIGHILDEATDFADLWPSAPGPWEDLNSERWPDA
jgi:hypothetical protein